MIDLIDSRLQELIPNEKKTLFEAARYSLFPGGKRVRPLLVLKAAESFGLNPLHLLDPACSLELVHTYSLIHDDLPCMDNDDFRREKPSLHKAFSESTALLTGDYLLTLSFEVLSKAEILPQDQRLQMIQTLASFIGGEGMIEGQIIDMEQSSSVKDEQILLKIHEKKTSKLFTACLEFVSIAAQLSLKKEIEKIGILLGLIYQFQDDLSDLSDAAQNKLTAVSLFGPALVETKVKSMKQELFHSLHNLPCKNSSLFDLIEDLTQRNS